MIHDIATQPALQTWIKFVVEFNFTANFNYAKFYCDTQKVFQQIILNHSNKKKKKKTEKLNYSLIKRSNTKLKNKKSPINIDSSIFPNHSNIRITRFKLFCKIYQ